MKVSINEQIESILDEFDFYKVQKVMQALNWNWATSNVENGTPTISELRKTARHLLKDVADVTLGYSKIGTGGFYAQRDSEGCLTLSFTVEEWNGYDIFSEQTSFQP
jgi:hypothetical protein